MFVYALRHVSCMMLCTSMHKMGWYTYWKIMIVIQSCWNSTISTNRLVTDRTFRSAKLFGQTPTVQFSPNCLTRYMCLSCLTSSSFLTGLACLTGSSCLTGSYPGTVSSCLYYYFIIICLYFAHNVFLIYHHIMQKYLVVKSRLPFEITTTGLCLHFSNYSP